jgi:carboxylesterase type B
MSEAIVETRQGKVRGTALGPMMVWKGVPFAQPPIGALRFRPPQPLEAWSGVRDATTFGPIAPQGTLRVSGFVRVRSGTGASERGLPVPEYLVARGR